MPTKEYKYEEYIQCLQTNNDLLKELADLRDGVKNCSCKKKSCDACTKAKARMVVLDPLLTEATDRAEVAKLLAGCDPYDSADSVVDEQKGSKVPDGRPSKRRSRRKR